MSPSTRHHLAALALAAAASTATSVAVAADDAACHTAHEGEACYDAVQWALTVGILEHPDWYPGLSSQSSFEDFQALLQRTVSDCQTPCPATNCETAAPGSDCYAAVRFARSQEVFSHPDWYPGVSANSSFEDFQRVLFNKNQSNCSNPCPARENPGFQCTSDELDLKVVKPAQKGLNLDDSSFHWCHEDIPSVWPNTKEPVGSLRLFHSWEIDWDEGGRTVARADLVRYVQRHNVKVLVGSAVTCNQTDDDLDWNRTLELIQMLGPNNILGVAVGNEVDLLYTQEYVKSTPECIPELWAGGRYWRVLQERFQQLDNLGPAYSKLPITTVWSPAVVGGDPFVETENAMATSLMRNASALYGQRWVWSINYYSYWNAWAFPDFPFFWRCGRAIHRATCWNAEDMECEVMQGFKGTRQKIKQITNRDDDIFWVSEIGWSSPRTSHVQSMVMRLCSDFTSKQTFAKFYEDFLNYDLGAVEGVRGPDHIFYFSMRDARQFTTEEHFGLLDAGSDPKKLCDMRDCKLKRADFPTKEDSFFNPAQELLWNANANASFTSIFM